MLDRNALLRSNQEQINLLLDEENTRLLLWDERKILLQEQSESAGQLKLAPILFKYQDLSSRGINFSPPIYLGCYGDCHYFSAQITQPVTWPLDHLRLDLRSASQTLESLDLELLITAQGLLNWHDSHQFCGQCGHLTHIVQAGHARQCNNPSCQKMHFPRIEPAVIFAIIDRQSTPDRILLARQPSWDQYRYSVIAGFVEHGESIEQAVCREAFEEVGLEVNEIVYKNSQPWPFPASLMLGFQCNAVTCAIELRDQELEDARWFSAEQVALAYQNKALLLPNHFSISRHLIEAWYLEQTGQKLAQFDKKVDK